jgi:DNA-binding NtrC family response regulator
VLEPTQQESSVQRKRILLVEDDLSLREVVRELLIIDDHSVVEANNGAEAFGLFKLHQFDLVVTDCRMPFVAGNELATQIRLVAPQQPILMITGHRTRTSASNPVDAILEKPFDMAQFRTAIADVLNIRN